MSTTNELQSLEEQINALQAKKQAILDNQRGDALKEVKRQVAAFGFTAAELGLEGKAAARAKSVKKADGKYSNPADPSQTWAGGRGMKPKWVREHLDAGGTLDALLIQK